MIAPGIDHWTSQEEGFPWDLFGEFMSDPEILRPQMEDGMILDPQRVNWSAFGQDPRRIIYLFAMEEQIAGYTLLQGRGVACAEFHMTFQPWARGRLAKGLGLWTMAKLFSDTTCRKLRTEIPRYNKAACRMAVELGMEREGVIRETFLFNGRMCDTVIYGVTRDGFLVSKHIRTGSESSNNGTGAVYHH